MLTEVEISNVESTKLLLLIPQIMNKKFVVKLEEDPTILNERYLTFYSMVCYIDITNYLDHQSYMADTGGKKLTYILESVFRMNIDTALYEVYYNIVGYNGDYCKRFLVNGQTSRRLFGHLTLVLIELIKDVNYNVIKIKDNEKCDEKRFIAEFTEKKIDDVWSCIQKITENKH